MNEKEFALPPDDYREIPFWSWNDRLKPEELRRQIRLMKQGGWGGFFMHARIGLKTPYLGKEWMECIRVCVEEAKAQGMEAWLYDEDKWPSGFAGGLSVAARPEHRAQYLICKVDDRPAWLQERMITFLARSHAGQLDDFMALETPELGDSSERIVQFYTQTMPLNDPWFNEYAYLSLLNPEAVRSFIESTHEVYRREIGQEFGKTVPGIFTDEPCTYFRVNRSASPANSLPWEKSLPEVFRQRRGYDLLPLLPALFYDWKSCPEPFFRVRFDYWRTITEMFVHAFSRQIGNWCRDNQLKFTGHFMSEDTLLSQIQWGLASAMPHYAWMDYPGIDHLGRQIGKIYGKILTIKQLDSAGCQLGKQRMLVENYALAGQDFSHQGRKWLGDWAAVMGANLHNLHLGLYSLRGERKRDCPPDLFLQQPWWPENKLMADYMARLSYALSRGKRLVDILVIHPIGSAWAMYTPGAAAAVQKLDGQLDLLLTSLLENQRDFHLGDELMIHDEVTPAKVVQGKSSARLEVGEMSYRVVIVPSGVTLMASTVQLLKAFWAAGGQIFAIPPLPYCLDGKPFEGELLAEVVTASPVDQIAAHLDQCLPQQVKIQSHSPELQSSIWIHQRILDDGQSAQDEPLLGDLLFLANTHPELGGKVTLSLATSAHVEVWDLAEGGHQPLPCRIVPGGIEAQLDFAPAGSFLLSIEEEQRSETGNSAGVASSDLSEMEIALQGEWSIVPGAMNAIPMDQAAWRLREVKSGEAYAWQEPAYILDIHNVLAEMGVGTPFELQYRLWSEVVPGPEVFMALEAPECFTIEVNGREVVPDPQPVWWIDPAFILVRIGPLLQSGDNQIVLKGVFGLETELEAVYLTGDFGVRSHRLKFEASHNGQSFDRYAPQFSLSRAGQSIHPRPAEDRLALDLTANGYPFYAGRMKLIQKTQIEKLPERAVILLDHLVTAVAHIRVNGRLCGSLAWKPHSLDITNAIRVGENEIEIELVNTLRNLLGPHHQIGGEKDYTGPQDYREKRSRTDDYILAPWGLDQVRLILSSTRPENPRETPNG